MTGSAVDPDAQQVCKSKFGLNWGKAINFTGKKNYELGELMN